MAFEALFNRPPCREVKLKTTRRVRFKNGEEVEVKSISVGEKEGQVNEVIIIYNNDIRRNYWVEDDEFYFGGDRMVVTKIDRGTWGPGLLAFLSAVEDEAEVRKIVSGLKLETESDPSSFKRVRSELAATISS